MGRASDYASHPTASTLPKRAGRTSHVPRSQDIAERSPHTVLRPLDAVRYGTGPARRTSDTGYLGSGPFVDRPRPYSQATTAAAGARIRTLPQIGIPR